MYVVWTGEVKLRLSPPPGQCISKFTNRKVPYCVKFNPDEEKQNLFVAGMSDKKIVQVMATAERDHHATHTHSSSMGDQGLVVDGRNVHTPPIFYTFVHTHTHTHLPDDSGEYCVCV